MYTFSYAKRIRMACDSLVKHLQDTDVLDSHSAEIIGFIRGAAYTYMTDEEKGKLAREPDDINLSEELLPHD